MKILIIGGKFKARSLTKTILKNHCPDVKEIAEANNLSSGVEIIREFQPNLIFMDIEKPIHSDMQMTEFLEEDEPNFQLVFTTTYSKYLVKAFEINALNYLLKLMCVDKMGAIEKTTLMQNNKCMNAQLVALQDSINHLNFEKIGLPVADGVLFIELSTVVFLEADGMFVRFYTENDGDLLVSKPLKYFVDLLADNIYFFRSHRSYLINVRHVRQLVRKDGTYIIMDNGKTANIVREKVQELLDILSSTSSSGIHS